jgi:hypothetical protein
VFKRTLCTLSMLVIAATLACSVASAQEVDQATITELSQNWLAQKAATTGTTRTILNISRIEDAPAGVTAYVVRLSPHGHIVFMGDTRLPQIMAFSLNNDIDLTPGPRNTFRALLHRDLGQMKHHLDATAGTNNLTAPTAIRQFIENNQSRWQSLLQRTANGAAPGAAPIVAATASSASVGPLLTTTWDQGRYYNALDPDDPYASASDALLYYGKVPAGCSPVALGQLMRYYEWPPHGQGTWTDVDNSGWITGSYSADYSNSYDWADMLDAYDPSYNGYSTQQVTAVSELLYEIGVLLEADYESSSNGGTGAPLYQSQVNDHLFYQGGQYVTTDIVNQMQGEITADRPTLGIIPDHAVVVDGYDPNGGYFHVNYGWGGENNDWYLLNGIPGGGLEGFYAAKPSYNPLLESASYLPGTADIGVQWDSPSKVTPPIDRFRVSLPSDQYYASWIDDATSLTNWTTAASPDWGQSTGWQPVPVDGRSAFYSGLWPDQLTLQTIIVPQNGTSLVLNYKLLLNSGSLTVAVSEDALNWTNLYQESGSTTYQSPTWESHTIDLSAYAGKAIQLRISQEPSTSGYFYYWNGGGIWIDKVTLNQTSIRNWSAVDDNVDASTRSYTISNAGANVPQIRVEAMADGAWAGSSVMAVSGSAVTTSYLLTVGNSGTGGGTVTSIPAGITCGSDCSESYPASTGVTLTAAPDGNSSFTSWGGACTGSSSSCLVSMTAAKNVTATFTIKTSQTIGAISFNPATLTVGGTTTASATATSGLAVSFTSTTPSICAVSGTTVTAVAAGTCTVAADQAGNASYTAATRVNQGISIGKAGQTIGAISFSPATLAIGGTTTASATATSGLAVNFTSTTPAVCTTSGTNGHTVTSLTSGTCTVAADQAGNASYNAAAQVIQSITVGTAGQTIGAISFNPSSVALGGTTTANATASSGLAVSFTSTTPAVCTTSGTNGHTVTSLTPGTCTVAADQAGNTSYNPAPQVTQSITISTTTNKASQTISAISFSPAKLTVGGTTTARATASSKLPVSFTSTTPAVCTTSGTNGSKVKAITDGTCIVAANQAGNSKYDPAPQATNSITISMISQTIGAISFSPAKLTVGGTTTARALASSKLPVSFSSATPAVCTTSGTNGSKVTVISEGTCIVAANQAGNTVYSAASQVTKSITVLKINQTIGAISFSPAKLTVGGTTTARALASSKLTVSFSSTTPAICTTSGINGSKVTAITGGTCTIAAGQGGNTAYNAAPQVTKTITITKSSQKIGAIRFAPAIVAVGGTTTASASASSTLAVSFSSITPTICITSGANGSTVTAITKGKCTVAANQGGNSTYNAAHQVTQNITISKVSTTGGPSVSSAFLPPKGLAESIEG